MTQPFFLSLLISTAFLACAASPSTQLYHPRPPDANRSAPDEAEPGKAETAEEAHRRKASDPTEFAFRDQEERLNDPHRYLMVGSVSQIWTSQHFDFETSGIPYRIKLAGTRGLYYELYDLHVNDRFYRKALHWLSKRILNREIHVVFDPSAVHQDRFGQLVLYVFYQPDGSDEWVFLNREMIEEGYAIYKEQEGWIHDKELKQAQRRAKIEQKGVWGELLRRNNEKMKKVGALDGESVSPDDAPKRDYKEFNPDPPPRPKPCVDCKKDKR